MKKANNPFSVVLLMAIDFMCPLSVVFRRAGEQKKRRNDKRKNEKRR